MTEIVDHVGKILHRSEKDTIKEALEEAVFQGAHLDDAQLDGAHLEGAQLDGAHLEGAWLQGVFLHGAHLEGAYLEGAQLFGAHLEGAWLQGAYLEGAHLGGTHLFGANFEGSMIGAIRLIDGGLRADGHRFLYTDFQGEGPRIKAGCREFKSFAEARRHWQETRGGTMLGEETMLILDNLEKLVALRWGKEKS
jgi:hypothetical protein